MSVITKDLLETIFDKKLDPLKEKIDSLIESFDFFDGKLRELNSSCSRVDMVMEERSGQVEKENKLLKEEVVKLRNELKIQRESTNDLEQYIRRECIEISGIPENPLENTNEIVIKVGNLMGVEIDSGDISVSHRLPVKPTSYSDAVRRDRRPRDSKTIAKFVRRDVRDKFYRGRKRLSNKTTRDLGFSDQSGYRSLIFNY